MNKRSFLLSDKWDISLGADGNIKTTSGTYCDAQNVANAARLFTKDAYFRRTKGIPHFSLDLSVMPTMSEVALAYRNAALGVENIRDASIEVTGIDENRTLTGVITATTTNRENISIEF